MKSSAGPWTLIEHAEPISLIRLDPGSDLPNWADGLPLTSVIWSARETTVVCPSRCVPDSLPGTIEGPMTAFELGEDLSFTVSGVMSALAVPLAEAQVSLFALSTFDTHWVLVAAQSTQAAKASWARDGHTIVEAAQPRKARHAMQAEADQTTDEVTE